LTFHSFYAKLYMYQTKQKTRKHEAPAKSKSQ
jgi:hypothetical protein